MRRACSYRFLAPATRSFDGPVMWILSVGLTHKEHHHQASLHFERHLQSIANASVQCGYRELRLLVSTSNIARKNGDGVKCRVGMRLLVPDLTG